MEKTIVLYPSAGIGHLISMVELGKLILNKEPSFSIIIFISSAPYTTGSTTPYINHVSSTTASITFHHLPTVTLPPNTSTLVEEMAYQIPRLNNPDLKLALQNISEKSSLKAFIIDFFCTAAFEVSSSLEIPTYFFFTTNASGLCELLYNPFLHETITEDFQDFNGYVNIPGIPSLFCLDLPKPLLEKNTKLYKEFLNTANQMAKCSGIIVNTFEALESKAVKALNEGLCTPNVVPPPLIYCIGPLIASGNDYNQEHECFTWLNSQPSKSVVFLCFGSLGTFDKHQLNEIAIGLENSGHKFLWVVKNPPVDDDKLPQQEPGFDELLPKGFLKRTEDRGLVVKSWAPQLAILNHDAIGGFVTHCGWNSVLEAVCGGVPMVAWPLYAEQKMNRVFMVEEMKVALALVESNQEGFVMGCEIEKCVKELMDSKNGEAIRDQVMVMSEKAKAALVEGGSSYIALTKLLNVWK